MIKQIVTVFFTLLLSSAIALASEPKLMNSQMGGKLYQENGVNIVTVTGSFYQMGEEYGTLLKGQLQSFYTEMDKAAKMNFLLKHSLEDISRLRYPKQEMDFIKGESRTSGLSVRHLIFLDQAVLFTVTALSPHHHHVGPGCSFIAAWGAFSKDGNMVLGRNFDWAKPFKSIMQNYLTITIMNPGQGSNSIATVGYTGWIGALTAVNSKGLFLDLNSGLDSVGPDFRFIRKSYFSEIVNIMMASNTLTDLKNAVLATKPDAPYIINIADNNTAYSIEDSSAHIKNFAKLRTATSKTVYPNSQAENGLLVATNTYRMPGWKRTLFKKQPYPATTLTESFIRYNNLISLGDCYKGHINQAIMQSILQAPLSQNGATEYSNTTLSTNPDYTFYSVVFLPKTLTLSVSTPTNSATNPPQWTTINLANYFSPDSMREM